MVIGLLLGEPTRLYLGLRLVSLLHTALVPHRRKIEMIIATEPRRPNGPMLKWQKLHHLATVIAIPVRHRAAQRTEALMFAMHHQKPHQQRQFLCQPTTAPIAPLSFLHLLVHAVVHLLLTAAHETTPTAVHHLTVAAVHLQLRHTMGPHHASNMTHGHHHQTTLPTARVLRIMARQPLTKSPIARHHLFAPITAVLQHIHARSASIILLLHLLSKKVAKRYRV